ncbi:MAG: ABC transporter ATP-binding protein [Pseudomonadota bacterium]
MSFAIQIENVSKRYEHFQLDSLDLQLETGRIMGFIGPNGAGKSSTLRILMGLVTPDAGNVEVLGHRIPDQETLAKTEVGFASEDIRLYGHATLDWHMGFVRSVFARWDEAYANELLGRFDLIREQKIKGMSHGQRVKAQLLLVLARRPRLLLLDEPTTGLDPVARSEVLDELVDVLLDEDRSVLFSSHNTNDVEQICDQITFIDRGRLVTTDDKETFIDNWRRLRFEAPNDVDVKGLGSLVTCRQDGSVGSLVLNRDDPGAAERIRSAGGAVVATERLNLEEIFVAAVKAKRLEDAA